MLKKNQEIVCEISDMGCSGEGIAKIDGYAVFVPYALPGETVRIKILKAKSGYAFARLEEIVFPSPFRCEVPCPVYKKCGGCNLQHLDYEKQLEWKAQTVADCFKKIAGIELSVPKTESAGGCFRYRNKLQLPIRHTQKGNVIGFFREGSHDVIPIDDCLIQSEWVKDIIELFMKFVEVSGNTCFDEQTGRGNIKHLVVREVCSRLIITVVITQKSLKNSEILVDILSERFSDFSLFVNYNNLNNNVIFGKEFRLICGEERIFSSEDGIAMPMGPESFMQVNDSVRRRIYDCVDRLVSSYGGAVIDAYSGAGFLTARLASHADCVYGVECIKEAVDCADKLARENGIINMTNICGFCENVIPRLVEEVKSKHEGVSVVLDPPRKGCDVAVIESLIKAMPDRIVYVSCNPSTLARDVGLLCGALEYCGKELKKTAEKKSLYNVEYIQPFDMFPMTKHVESVVCLTRRLDNELSKCMN